MNKIQKLEASLINFIAAVTPWLAPLIPAYLVYHNMTERLGYPPIFGLIGAAAVEFLGLSAVHTAVTFWQWNDAHKVERAPFWFAFGAGLFYVGIVLTVNAALDIWQDSGGVKIFAHALLSLLSVDAALIIAIRAQHARRLNERELARIERREARTVRGQPASAAESTALQAADHHEQADKPRTYADYVRLSTDRNGSGPLTTGELLSIGVGRSSAYEWPKQYAKQYALTVEEN